LQLRQYKSEEQNLESSGMWRYIIL
jgi:hypothetical protein